MPYSAENRSRVTDTEELRRRIPGWGADLDPADRPAVPREQSDPERWGAHWEVPAQQGWHHEHPRERSIEHGQLTAVFGTAQPLHGLSGAVRRCAYDRFSEARAVHWLLLVLGDRVDALGSHLRSFATLRPDNPVTETGVLAEFGYDGIRSRRGRGRIDLAHVWLDPILIAGPFVLGGVLVLRALQRRRH